MRACLFCGGDRDERTHAARCTGAPPAAGSTPETWAASVDAARHVEPNAETLRAIVLAHIRTCGCTGATDDEIQAALALDGNTERPRRWELSRAALIVPAGHRVNARGRRCAVWVTPEVLAS